MRAKLIFDDGCYLCRMLAAFVDQRSSDVLDVIAWSRYRDTAEATQLLGAEHTATTRPESLWVIDDQQVFADAAAWQWLMNIQPDLATLTWLARKLNLQAPAAKMLAFAGRRLPRICRSCRS